MYKYSNTPKYRGHNLTLENNWLILVPLDATFILFSLYTFVMGVKDRGGRKRSGR
jgi:hypothetical protein